MLINALILLGGTALYFLIGGMCSYLLSRFFYHIDEVDARVTVVAWPALPILGLFGLVCILLDRGSKIAGVIYEKAKRDRLKAEKRSVDTKEIPVKNKYVFVKDVSRDLRLEPLRRD